MQHELSLSLSGMWLPKVTGRSLCGIAIGAGLAVALRLFAGLIFYRHAFDAQLRQGC